MVKSILNRREFIGTTAAAGAGLLLTSCSPDNAVAPKKKSVLNNINVALIGYGAEGGVLSESLMNIMNAGGIKVVAASTTAVDLLPDGDGPKAQFRVTASNGTSTATSKTVKVRRPAPVWVRH